MTCTMYCLKIEETFDAMIRLAYEVLPENRRTINFYINDVWRLVTVFVQSISRDEATVLALSQHPMERDGQTQELMTRFEPYVAAEEKRLLRNLEDINYRVDGPDTVRVVSGGNRIEMVNKAVAIQIPYDSDRRPTSRPSFRCFSLF